jgi:hypothetical protein
VSGSLIYGASHSFQGASRFFCKTQYIAFVASGNFRNIAYMTGLKIPIEFVNPMKNQVKNSTKTIQDNS